MSAAVPAIRAEEKKAEKTAVKTPPVVAGGIQRPIVYDPQAREKALAKAAEERPTDVIFLQEVVVLASRDDRRIGQAILWQKDLMAASHFSFENGGAFWKDGSVGLFKYENPMAKDSAFSTKAGSPRIELFRLQR
jgi:hypothetical protein